MVALSVVVKTRIGGECAVSICWNEVIFDREDIVIFAVANSCCNNRVRFVLSSYVTIFFRELGNMNLAIV